MGGQAVVKVLHAAVRVMELDKETKEPLLQPIGFGADGKAIMRPATRIVLVQQNQPLPDNIAEGEYQRLEAAGVLTTSPVTPAAAIVEKPKPAPSDAAKKAEEQARADKATLDRLAELTPEELTKFLTDSQVGVRSIKAAVGTNAELAARMIAAENEARKGDARGSLITDMERIVKKTAEGGQSS